MAITIVVANQKGGVGKTTTAVNLAYNLAKMKYRTLLIDLDPQGNATSGLGFNKNDLGASMTEVMLGMAQLPMVILKTDFKNLALAPTTPQLANAEVEMTKMEKKFKHLKEAMAEVADEYDYMIIDSPPSLSLLTVNAMVAVEYLLLPVQTEFYAMEGMTQLLNSMQLVRKGMNPRLQLLGVLATMHDKRTALSEQVLGQIKKYFKTKVFKTVIPRNVRVAEAPSHGVPVGSYDKFSKGAKAYRMLTQEIIERVGKGAVR